MTVFSTGTTKNHCPTKECTPQKAFGIINSEVVKAWLNESKLEEKL